MKRHIVQSLRCLLGRHLWTLIQMEQFDRHFVACIWCGHERDD